MDSSYFGALGTQLAYAAPLVLGLLIGAALMAPRAGAGRGLIWGGAAALVLARLVSVGFSSAIPYLARTSTAGMATWSLGMNLVTTVLQIAGVLVLMGAAAKAAGPPQRQSVRPQPWPPSSAPASGPGSYPPGAGGYPPAGPSGYPPPGYGSQPGQNPPAGG